MNLRHLCSTLNVEVYFDSWNNWLYLEWVGELDLPAAQHASLAIARCFVAHAYPRVLTNHAGLLRMAPEAGPWLAQHFLPYLALAGVRQLAWVHGPHERPGELARLALRYLGPLVNAAVFAEAEEAVGWLQYVRPGYASGCELLPRRGQRDTKLKYLLKAFEQEVAATRAAPTPAPVTSAALPA